MCEQRHRAPSPASCCQMTPALDTPRLHVKRSRDRRGLVARETSGDRGWKSTEAPKPAPADRYGSRSGRRGDPPGPSRANAPRVWGHLVSVGPEREPVRRPALTRDRTTRALHPGPVEVFAPDGRPSPGDPQPFARSDPGYPGSGQGVRAELAEAQAPLRTIHGVARGTLESTARRGNEQSAAAPCTLTIRTTATSAACKGGHLRRPVTALQEPADDRDGGHILDGAGRTRGHRDARTIQVRQNPTIMPTWSTDH